MEWIGWIAAVVFAILWLRALKFQDEILDSWESSLDVLSEAWNEHMKGHEW